MSTEVLHDSLFRDGAPELTALGKKVEILRIERGISKQRLARHAGTSRQQLWRVMTGKSELTSSLRERLAAALSVEPANLCALLTDQPSHTYSMGAGHALNATLAEAADAPVIADYLTDAAHLTRTMSTLPSGDAGRRLKRALLNAVEDLAVEASQALPPDYSEIRRRVLAGEL